MFCEENPRRPRSSRRNCSLIRSITEVPHVSWRECADTFFFFFSLPCLSHSLPWFCCHIPLSNVCPTHPTCRGRSFKKLPGVLKLLPLQGALLIALYPGRCPGLWASAPSGRAACVFCKKKRSHFGLFCHKGFTVLRHLWRFGEYLWREGSRPESPLFIGLPTQMWRVNPRFLLYTHTRKKINKERKQQYG